MSAEQLMDVALMAEPSVAGPSVLSKRKRELETAQLMKDQPGYVSATENIKKAIPPLSEDFSLSLGFRLEDHPDYSFLYLLAGTMTETSVRDMIALPENQSDLEERRAEAISRRRSAQQVAVSLFQSLDEALDDANEYTDDDKVAKNVGDALANVPMNNQKRIADLNTLLSVREYFQKTGTTSVEAGLVSQINERFNLKYPTERNSGLDTNLAVWLLANGKALLADERGAGTKTELPEEFRRPSEPGPSSPRQPSTAPGGRRGGGSEGLESGMPQKTFGPQDVVAIGKDAEALYVSIPAITQELERVRVLESSTGVLEELMKDFEESFRTQNPREGAQSWLTQRNRIVQQKGKTLGKLSKEFLAAVEAVERSKADVDTLTDALQSAFEFYPDAPLRLKEEVNMGVMSALTLLKTTNPEGYGRASLQPLMRGEDVVKTAFARLAGLEVLRDRLHYPDRYRPVMMLTKIEVEEKNAIQQLANYEYVGGGVRRLS